MMNVLKVIIPVVVIALICIVLNLINGKKSRRVRHFPFVILSVIVIGVAIYFLVKYSSFPVIITRRVGFFAQADLLILNLALILGFLIVKLLFRSLFSAIFKSNAVLKIFALTIYEFDEEYCEWFIRKQWMNFRKFVFWLVAGSSVFSGVYLGLTWLLGPNHKLWMMIFPCAVTLVINEIYGYVNGLTKEEYEYSVMGKDADARRISNYYKLREILEKILPYPLLSAHTGFEFLGKETPADIIKKLKDSENNEDRITAEYFDLNGRYKTADVDCVQATLNMMYRKNVVFFNPFYRDSSMYIMLPMSKSLLSGKKCTVICGRKNMASDVEAWLSDTVREYSHMKSLWRVGHLSDKEPEFDIGIITFTQLYDKRIINANRDFFSETDFVLMLEPSLMLNTGQVALSIIAEEMNANGDKPVYCVCDRFTDGLVDTVSHLIRSEITDVVAVPVPRCSYTVMSWDADGDFCRQQLFDKQTRYLGNGIELAGIAVKNQIPAVTWYGERRAPIRDIKWIAGQHFSTICRYMNLPCQQKNLYEKIKFIPNLWCSDKTQEQFLIAEDEFFNMFSVMRTYLSRGKNQIFVNVLSENYLLRDYMRCNSQMFMSNPNAVPSFVPDYAKTERNTILKLIIMMTLRPVKEDEVLKELHLIGIDTDDAFSEMVSLLKKYTYADDTIFTVGSLRANADELTARRTGVYSVAEEDFDEYFSDSLKNAYYILEDEKDEEGYLDAKMFSHVTQTILPGQFVTYDGKYYQAKYVSPQSGVVLRRASDQYDGRKYYRQIRNYSFDFGENPEVVSYKKIDDIEFTVIRTDFKVETTGYLELSDSHDLRSARTVDFSKDPSVDSYTRSYRNKSILKIKLPEADDKICFTICLLMSEVMRSIFPDGWPYIAIMTKRPEDIGGMLNYLVYPAYGDIEPGYIYIVEDSDVDLGLIDSLEKNFMRIMEVIADFLDWHFEKMREPAPKDPIPEKIAIAEKEVKKRRNVVLRMLDRIRKLFRRKKEEPVQIEKPDDVEKEADSEAGSVDPEGEVSSVNETENVSAEGFTEAAEDDFSDSEGDRGGEAVALADGSEYSPDDESENEGEKEQEPAPAIPETEEIDVAPEEYPEDELKTDDPNLTHTDGTDIFEEDPQASIDYRVEEQLRVLDPIEITRYQKECFLKFGYEEIDGRIRADDLRCYLRLRGWCNNSLTLARKRDVFVRSFLDVEAENHCDFCGLPLSGVSYEKLNDGRVRCNDCSSSAITSLADFKELFFRCIDLMEDFFDIRYHIPISVNMTDAKEVANGAGCIFKPSTGVTSRVLGYARKSFGKYSLVVENGSPRLASINTIVHEMTHIWQYLNWNQRDVISIYGLDRRECSLRAKDIVYEGMAMWAAIQYLYQIGESYYAAQQEILAELRNDVYGAGFRLYRERYPLVKDASLLKYSPFSSFPPLDPDDVRQAARSLCSEDPCIC